MRAEDVSSLADALYIKMKPDVSQLVVGLLEPVIRRLDALSRGDSGRVASRPSPGGSDASGAGGGGGPTAGAGSAVSTSEAEMRLIVREELDASEERRQPALALQQEKLLKATTGAVEASVMKCLQEKPVELMTDEEIQKAALASLPTKSIRQHHGPVLNECIKMLMEDDRYKGDALTASFPPSSPLYETLVNEAFSKIVLGIVQRVYKSNGELSPGKQPHIFKGKDRIVPSAMDRVDRAVVNITRNCLHDPRCKTRRLAVRMFLYYFLKNDGCMTLSFPDAQKPAAADGAGADYFAVQMELRASCSGLLPVGNAPAAPHVSDAAAGSPLAGVHTVMRTGSLYGVASTILANLVREPYTFDQEVVFSIADTLHGILTDPVTTWTEMQLKEAVEINDTGTWALLLPSKEVRKDASRFVQTLTEKEKENILAKHREEARAARAAAGGEAGESGASPAPALSGDASPPVPVGSDDWLRRLAL